MKHIRDLTADPQNRRLHNPRNIGLLVDALHQVGAARSIVIDEDGVILAGNGVVEAAGEAGITKLQVVEADGQTVVAVRRRGLTEAQKRALALFDNRTAELATWNVEQLLLDQTAGLELKPFWTQEELAALLQGNGGPKAGRTDPDAVPEVRATDIQRGDLFELGKHRLLCGDSTVAADVARVMGEERAELLLTDPPYGIAIVKAGMVGADFGVAKKGKYAPIIGDDQPVSIDHLAALAKHRIIWGGNYFPLPVSPTWFVWDKRRDSGIENTFADCELAWANVGGPARVYRQLWNGMIREGEHETRQHPTQKPVALMGWCLERSSTTGHVLDCYAGSGTTLIAAEQLGRACRAIEIEPSYCQVIIDRWEAFTGQKALKVGEAVREPSGTHHMGTHGRPKASQPSARRRRQKARARD
jgi:DNA methylase